MTLATVYGHGLLVAPLVPLLAAIHRVQDGNIGRCSPAAAQGRVKLGCLVADGVLGSDAALLLDGVLGCVSQFMGGP
jgi:hypothetical protein